MFNTKAKLTNKMIKQHNVSNPKPYNQVEANSEELEKETGGFYNYKLAKKDPKIWLVLAKDWIITRMQKGYSTTKDLAAAMENDDNFLDVWDMFKDLLEIRKMYPTVKSMARKEDPELAKELQSMFAKLKNQGRVFERAQGLGWKFGPGGGQEFKEASKRALELKKAGSKDAREKARGKKFDDGPGAKDLSVSEPVKGKVNISQIVGKAIQAQGGLDRDIASKITPIIKKKVAAIISKHLHGDIKIVEAKVERYVKAAVREVTEGLI